MANQHAKQNLLRRRCPQILVIAAVALYIAPWCLPRRSEGNAYGHFVHITTDNKTAVEYQHDRLPTKESVRIAPFRIGMVGFHVEEISTHLTVGDLWRSRHHFRHTRRLRLEAMIYPHYTAAHDTVQKKAEHARRAIDEIPETQRGDVHTLMQGGTQSELRIAGYLEAAATLLATCLALLGVTLFTHRSARAQQQSRRRRLGECLRCGYQLRPETRVCPECGSDVAHQPHEQ